MLQPGMYSTHMMMAQNMQEHIQDYNLGMDANVVKYETNLQSAYIHKRNLDMSNFFLVQFILNSYI